MVYLEKFIFPDLEHDNVASLYSDRSFYDQHCPPSDSSAPSDKSDLSDLSDLSDKPPAGLRSAQRFHHY